MVKLISIVTVIFTFLVTSEEFSVKYSENWTIQKDTLGIAYIFLHPDCPISQKYGKTIRELNQTYSQKGIYFIGVVPDPYLEEKDVKAYAKDYKFEFPVILDKDYSIVKKFKATVTPQIILLDELKEIVYRGAINNWFYALGKYRREVTENYFSEALKAISESKPVVLQYTEPIGCMISVEHHN